MDYDFDVDEMIKIFKERELEYIAAHQHMPDPKYKVGDTVKFKCGDTIKTGQIYIVDRYGTFEQDEEVSYDIMVGTDNTLYKHIRESWIC